MRQLCAFVCSNSNIARYLQRYQQANELAELHVKMECATRWSGLFSCMTRFDELRESLPVMQEMGEVKALSSKVTDFLQPAFFLRLKGYLEVLSELNRLSEFYQTQKFPVGCFVPLLTGHLHQYFQPSMMDSAYIASLKKAFLKSVETRMLKCLSEPSSTFLQAAVLHPGVCSGLVGLGFVEQGVIDGAFDNVVDQAVLLAENDSVRPLLLGALAIYRGQLPRGEAPKVNISSLKESGSYFGVSHMSFWRGVVWTDPKTNKKATPNAEFLGSLAGVASMLLALPAAEAVDEFAFSSSGATFTKGRASMAPPTLEQVTVIRMYIRNRGFRMTDVQRFLDKALSTRPEEAEGEALRASEAAPGGSTIK